MRVLMTADTIGGVWTYALELARALAPHDVEVLLATMGRSVSSGQHEALRQQSNVRLFESTYRLEWMEEPWADVAEAGEWLLELERRFAPDLVHLNGYVHAALPWRAPCLVVGHSCVLSWWQAVKREPAPASWNRYRSEVTRGVRAADHVAAPTGAMLETLDHYYGPLSDARVLPNGRQSCEFLPGEKEPLVFTAGRLWDEAKNLAALEVVAGDLPWPVWVAGDAGHPEGGRAAFRHTRPLGWLTAGEIRSWLGRAAIYALPARYEPFGLSALEAALAGCALVLGDIPSLREVWGDAALFVPPDDTVELSSSLRRLMADDGLRRNLALAARRRALEFTPERMAGGYLSLYQQLAGTQSPSALPGREAIPCA